MDSRAPTPSSPPESRPSSFNVKDLIQIDDSEETENKAKVNSSDTAAIISSEHEPGEMIYSGRDNVTIYDHYRNRNLVNLELKEAYSKWLQSSNNMQMSGEL